MNQWPVVTSDIFQSQRTEFTSRHFLSIPGHYMCPQVVIWRYDLWIWIVDANILKKQSRTADKGWSFIFEIQRVVTTSHLKTWPWILGYPRGKSPRYLLDGRLGGPHSQSGCSLTHLLLHNNQLSVTVPVCAPPSDWASNERRSVHKTYIWEWFALSPILRIHRHFMTRKLLFYIAVMKTEAVIKL